MSVKTVCDRCGDPYDRFETYYEVDESLFVDEWEHPLTKSWVFCHECWNKMLKALEEK